MSIRNKFILILLFSLAAMAAGISFAAHFRTVREADAAFARQASAQLDRVDDIIHLYFRSAEKAAQNLAALPEAKNVALARDAATENGQTQAEAEAALIRRLTALPALVPGVEAAFCGYKNGSFHTGSADALPEGHDARTQAWYSDTAWGPTQASVTAIAISAQSKSLVATVASKINDADGHPLGVAAVVINLGALTDTLRDVRFGRNGYLALFDADSRVLFDPRAQENLLRPAVETDDALLALSQLPAGRHELSRDNTAYLAFSRVFPDTRWKAVILADKAEQAEPFIQAFHITLLVSLLACLGLACIGILLSFGAAHPLYALIRQSEALAQGNDEALGGIAGRGPDIAALQSNIGQLTGRVMLLTQAEKEHANAMETCARDAVSAERDQADKTARAAYKAASRDAVQALTQAATETGKEAASFTAWTGKLHDLAHAQAMNADTLRTAVANLLDDAATMARQAAETEKNAGAAFTRARKTDALMRDTAHTLAALEEGVQNLSPGLETFTVQTNEMAAITAVVRDVAEAINVLGLKLSIAISSAGEAGKPFIPMGEEMRALAGKAMAAAGSIDAVTAVFEQARAACSLAVNKNIAAAGRAAANAAKTGDELAGTVAIAGTTVEQIRVLATAMEGMAQPDTLNTAHADAILRATRDTDEALKALDATAASLAAFATRLAALAEGLESVPPHPAQNPV